MPSLLACRVVAVILLAAFASAQTPTGTRWVGSWAASQQVPLPPNALPPDALNGATLRQLVHLSLGGERLRLRLSNAFGTEPLHLSAVHIARPISPAGATVDPATDRPVTFDGGRPDVTIPAGAEYLSDPVAFHASALSDVAITLQYDKAPAGQTGHPGSRSTSYLSHGTEPAAADLPGAEKLDRWFRSAAWMCKHPRQPARSSYSVIPLPMAMAQPRTATIAGLTTWRRACRQSPRDA